MVKFYVVVYEYGYTVPIKATRKPTIQEAAAFCAVCDAGAVVSVDEISAEELLANYNCNGIDDWPVFDRPEVKAPVPVTLDTDDDGEEEDGEEEDGQLAVAVLEPARKRGRFVPFLTGFEPLSEMHRAAEEWVAMFNCTSIESNDSLRAVIIDFNTNALRVALQYAVLFSEDNTEGATVLL